MHASAIENIFITYSIKQRSWSRVGQTPTSSQTCETALAVECLPDIDAAHTFVRARCPKFSVPPLSRYVKVTPQCDSRVPFEAELSTC